MKIVIASLLALAAAQDQPPAMAPAAQLNAIEMDINSWGRVVARWSIDARGDGRYTLPEPEAMNPKRLVTRSFAAGSGGFRRVRILLGRAEARMGRQMPCAQRITDMHYGTVNWRRRDGRANALSYDMGCREYATRQVLDDIVKADAIVAAWAKDGPVVETEEVGS